MSAEEVLRVPGLVHGRQHFLEKQRGARSGGCGAVRRRGGGSLTSRMGAAQPAQRGEKRRP